MDPRDRPPEQPFSSPEFRARSVTELAYLRDADAAYARRFDARVTALPPGGVVLDRTYFYPVGGGQPSDHGTIGIQDEPPRAVVDVTRSGTAVVHRLRRAGGDLRRALRMGEEVVGEIDWERRHRHMRLHTAQHLLSALLFSRTGLRTRDARMSGNGGTIDLEKALPLDFEPARLAEEANTVLARDLQVLIRNVPRTEWDGSAAPRSGLVPLPRHVDPVRLIEIEGLDACPCGGTHVRSTGEIGALGIEPPVPVASGGVRVPFRLADRVLPNLPG